MENILSQLLPLAVFAIVFMVVPSVMARKAAQRKKGSGKQSAPQKAGENFPADAFSTPETKAEKQPPEEGGSLWEHDHTSWMGSLQVDSPEGVDPCHDEQLSPLSPPPEPVLEHTEAPAFSLQWTGSEVVRGLVVSEVLKRKTFPR